MNWIPIGIVKGEKGDPGTGLTIKDFYSTLDELRANVPNPSVGDAYGVGEEGALTIYIYSPSRNDWVNSGALQPDINEQAPVYLESSELEELTSKEKISNAFGKIAKAIKELISHLKDSVSHVTNEKRTEWDNKAPSGCGLGVIANGIRDVSFSDFMKNGGGFYQVKTTEDAPFNTQQWFGLLQLVRGLTEDKETGVQISFNDYDITNPKMWMRCLLEGESSDWVEMLHTGNLADKNVSRTEVITYDGNGKYGFENARTFTFSFKPKIFFISGYGRGGGNYTLTVPYGFPFAHTVVHTTDGGFAAMNCEFQYSGNSITMFNTTSANNGFNTDGKPYTIVAIG